MRYLIRTLLLLSALAGGLPAMALAEEAPATEAALNRVNINSADASTLATGLHGVGPKKAEAIIAYRSDHGAFEAVEELLEVRGIGTATLARNRDRIVLH